MIVINREALGKLRRSELLILLLEGQATIMSAIQDIKDDLAATKQDLTEIKAAVTSTVTTLQGKVTDLTAQVSALEAGKVLTDTELAGMVKTADDLRIGAEDVLAVVKPPTP